jgi:DICT domain-containing protein
MSSTVKKRSVKQTLLVVGEGYAEVGFIKHIKNVYGASVGRSVQEMNAHGKGGKHVLEVAIRRMRIRDYDKVILLLDTDTDWDDSDRKRARQERIGVIESDPCFEEWLLQILGSHATRNTKQCKQAFREQVGCDAHDPNYLERHFAQEVLDQARALVPQLADLMNHMGIPKR